MTFFYLSIERLRELRGRLRSGASVPESQEKRQATSQVGSQTCIHTRAETIDS